MRVQLFLMAVQTRATAAATWLLNVATTAMTLTNIGAVATFVATRIAMLAGAVATGVMTAAQWALNVALTANPIGLIIVGIAALIAILVAVGYAVWRFRDEIVDAFQFVLGWVRDNWPLLLAILTGPFGLAVYAIIRYKDQIIGIVTDLVDKIKEIWPDSLGDVLGGVGNAVGKVGNVLGFAEGGEVPGPEGAPMPAIVHGGETVLPSRVTRILREFIVPTSAPRQETATPMASDMSPIIEAIVTGFRSVVVSIVGLPAAQDVFAGTPNFPPIGQMFANLQLGPEALAPPLPPPAPVLTGAGRTVTIGDVTITVHTGEGANADEIADTIERRWKDQIEDLVADFDGPIVR